MDQVRFQRVENEVSKHATKLEEHSKLHELHNRRHEDQLVFNTSTTSTIKAMHELVSAVQKSTEVQEDILKALSLMGRAAKWVLAVAGACGAIVALVKGVKL